MRRLLLEMLLMGGCLRCLMGGDNGSGRLLRGTGLAAATSSNVVVVDGW